MHRDTVLGLNTPRLLRRYQNDLPAAVLALAMLLAGCATSSVGRENTIQGRWHRLAEPNMDDPFRTLASEYIEFRPNGVLASLLFDSGPQLFWTAITGEYVLSGTDQVTVKGRCWQGWRSYDCSRIYRFDLKGDRLTVYDGEGEGRRAEYERMRVVSSEVPPTLVPPMPTALPTAQE